MLQLEKATINLGLVYKKAKRAYFHHPEPQYVLGPVTMHLLFSPLVDAAGETMQIRAHLSRYDQSARTTQWQGSFDAHIANTGVRLY